jgi:hypothetical protein
MHAKPNVYESIRRTELVLESDAPGRPDGLSEDEVSYLLSLWGAPSAQAPNEQFGSENCHFPECG